MEEKITFFKKRLFLITLFVGINFINISYAQYDVNNDFIPDAFPQKPDSKIFSIPLNPEELIVVVPDTLKSNINNLQLLLSKKRTYIRLCFLILFLFHLIKELF